MAGGKEARIGIAANLTVLEGEKYEETVSDPTKNLRKLGGCLADVESQSIKNKHKGPPAQSYGVSTFRQYPTNRELRTSRCKRAGGLYERHADLEY